MGETPPEPERSVEQSQKSDQQQWPAEYSSEHVECDEQERRARESASDRVEHGQSRETEWNGQDDHHVDPEEARRPAEGRLLLEMD